MQKRFLSFNEAKAMAKDFGASDVRTVASYLVHARNMQMVRKAVADLRITCPELWS